MQIAWGRWVCVCGVGWGRWGGVGCDTMRLKKEVKSKSRATKAHWRRRVSVCRASARCTSLIRLCPRSKWPKKPFICGESSWAPRRRWEMTRKWKFWQHVDTHLHPACARHNEKNPNKLEKSHRFCLFQSMTELMSWWSGFTVGGRGSCASQLRDGNKVSSFLFFFLYLLTNVRVTQIGPSVLYADDVMMCLPCAFPWHNRSLGFQRLLRSPAVEEQLCIISHQCGSCEASSRKHKVMVRGESLRFSQLTKFGSRSKNLLLAFLPSFWNTFFSNTFI